MQAWHSQPENYDAVCSDAAALLAPRSQDRVESGHGVVQKGSVAFPAISGPAATDLLRWPSKHLGRRAMSESDRATSPVASA